MLMADLDRVVQVIGETITAEVTANAFRESMTDARSPVDVEKVAETAAGRLEREGLLA